jgi:hypothetical protein
VGANVASEIPAGIAVESLPRASGARISLFRYSPGLVLVAIVIADAVRVADPDLWGHVRFGLAVLTQGHLVHHDPYSYSVPSHIWNNHEWLAEVLMAAVFKHAGVPGLVMLKFACTALTVLMMVAALGETGATPLLQFGVLLFSIVVIRPELQFRPQEFTFTMLAAVLWLLTCDTYRRDGKLWIAIPILAIWANLHGGFIMGVAALGTYAIVAGAQDLLAGRGYGRLLKLIGIAIAATLATLATPYGIANWETVAHALRNPYTRLIITEWYPLTTTIYRKWIEAGFRISNYEVGLALMIALAICWTVTIEAQDLALVAVAALMAAAAVVSTRNLPIAAMAIAVPLVRHMSLMLARRCPAARGPGRVGRLWWPNQIVLVMLSLYLLVSSGGFETRIPAAEPYPVGACDFMNRHGLAGNILNDFNWGEYLIWHARRSKVFIDGRYDTVYPFDLIGRYAVFYFDRQGGAKLLGEYSHDFVMLRRSSPAIALMDSQPDWKLIYRDDAACLYAPRNSAAARIANAPLAGANRPAAFP